MAHSPCHFPGHRKLRSQGHSRNPSFFVTFESNPNQWPCFMVKSHVSQVIMKILPEKSTCHLTSQAFPALLWNQRLAVDTDGLKKRSDPTIQRVKNPGSPKTSCQNR